MAEVVKNLMCDMEADLQFTMEVQSDFASNSIPTLDFDLWLEIDSPADQGHAGAPADAPAGVKLLYKFYSKQVSTKYR